MFIQDNLFSKGVTAITKGPVKIKVSKIKGSNLQEARVKTVKNLKSIMF